MDEANMIARAIFCLFFGFCIGFLMLKGRS